MSKANVIVMGGESEIWSKYIIPDHYSAIIGIPFLSALPDGIVDMELFKKGFLLFEKMGKEWGHIKENILREKIITGLNSNDPSNLFEYINYYTIGAYGDIPTYFRNRWSNHSLFLDEFIHEINYLMFHQMSRKENCFFVSSGGPAIVFITKYPTIVKDMLKKLKFKTIIDCDLYSEGPKIIAKA